MPTLSIYKQQDFPSAYNWQAIAFMRCEWPSIFQGDILYLSAPYPPEADPIHFVMAEGDSLLSYATVMKKKISHAGRPFTIQAFGNMFTFAPYRKQGYGRKILNAATELIQQSDSDAGILFCDTSLEKYYAAEGWQTTPGPTYVGGPHEQSLYEPLRMMIFVSDKAKAVQAELETSPVWVDYPW